MDLPVDVNLSLDDILSRLHNHGHPEANKLMRAFLHPPLQSESEFTSVIDPFTKLEHLTDRLDGKQWKELLENNRDALIRAIREDIANALNIPLDQVPIPDLRMTDDGLVIDMDLPVDVNLSLDDILSRLHNHGHPEANKLMRAFLHPPLQSESEFTSVIDPFTKLEHLTDRLDGSTIREDIANALSIPLDQVPIPDLRMTDDGLVIDMDLPVDVSLSLADILSRLHGHEYSESRKAEAEYEATPEKTPEVITAPMPKPNSVSPVPAPAAVPPPAKRSLKRRVRVGFEGTEWDRLLDEEKEQFLLAFEKDTDRTLDVPCAVRVRGVKVLRDRVLVEADVKVRDRTASDTAVHQLRRGGYENVWSFYRRALDTSSSFESTATPVEIPGVETMTADGHDSFASRRRVEGPETTFHRIGFVGKSWQTILEKHYDAFFSAFVVDVSGILGLGRDAIQVTGVSFQHGVVVDVYLTHSPTLSPDDIDRILTPHRCDRVWALYRRCLKPVHSRQHFVPPLDVPPLELSSSSTDAPQSSRHQNGGLAAAADTGSQREEESEWPSLVFLATFIYEKRNLLGFIPTEKKKGMNRFRDSTNNDMHNDREHIYIYEITVFAHGATFVDIVSFMLMTYACIYLKSPSQRNNADKAIIHIYQFSKIKQKTLLPFYFYFTAEYAFADMTTESIHTDDGAFVSWSRVSLENVATERQRRYMAQLVDEQLASLNPKGSEKQQRTLRKNILKQLFGEGGDSSPNGTEHKIVRRIQKLLREQDLQTPFETHAEKSAKAAKLNLLCPIRVVSKSHIPSSHTPELTPRTAADAPSPLPLQITDRVLPAPPFLSTATQKRDCAADASSPRRRQTQENSAVLVGLSPPAPQEAPATTAVPAPILQQSSETFMSADKLTARTRHSAGESFSSAEMLPQRPSLTAREVFEEVADPLQRLEHVSDVVPGAAPLWGYVAETHRDALVRAAAEDVAHALHLRRDEVPDPDMRVTPEGLGLGVDVPVDAHLSRMDVLSQLHDHGYPGCRRLLPPPVPSPFASPLPEQRCSQALEFKAAMSPLPDTGVVQDVASGSWNCAGLSNGGDTNSDKAPSSDRGLTMAALTQLLCEGHPGHVAVHPSSGTAAFDECGLPMPPPPRRRREGTGTLQACTTESDTPSTSALDQMNSPPHRHTEEEPEEPRRALTPHAPAPPERKRKPQTHRHSHHKRESEERSISPLCAGVIEEEPPTRTPCHHPKKTVTDATTSPVRGKCRRDSRPEPPQPLADEGAGYLEPRAVTPPAKPRTKNPRRGLPPLPQSARIPIPPAPRPRSVSVRKVLRAGFEGPYWGELLSSGAAPLLLAFKEDATRMMDIPCQVAVREVEVLEDRVLVEVGVRAADKATADAAVRQLRAGEYTAVWSLYHQWVEAAESRRSAPSSPVTTFHRLRFEGKAWFVVLQQKYDKFVKAVMKDIRDGTGAPLCDVHLTSIGYQRGALVDYYVVHSGLEKETKEHWREDLEAVHCVRAWRLLHLCQSNFGLYHHLPPLKPAEPHHNRNARRDVLPAAVGGLGQVRLPENKRSVSSPCGLRHVCDQLIVIAAFFSFLCGLPTQSTLFDPGLRFPSNIPWSTARFCRRDGQSYKSKRRPLMWYMEFTTVVKHTAGNWCATTGEKSSSSCNYHHFFFFLMSNLFTPALLVPFLFLPGPATNRSTLDEGGGTCLSHDLIRHPVESCVETLAGGDASVEMSRAVAFSQHQKRSEKKATKIYIICFRMRHQHLSLFPLTGHLCEKTLKIAIIYRHKPASMEAQQWMWERESGLMEVMRVKPQETSLQTSDPALSGGGLTTTSSSSPSAQEAGRPCDTQTAVIGIPSAVVPDTSGWAPDTRVLKLLAPQASLRISISDPSLSTQAAGRTDEKLQDSPGAVPRAERPDTGVLKLLAPHASLQVSASDFSDSQRTALSESRTNAAETNSAAARSAKQSCTELAVASIPDVCIAHIPNSQLEDMTTTEFVTTTDIRSIALQSIVGFHTLESPTLQNRPRGTALEAAHDPPFGLPTTFVSFSPIAARIAALPPWREGTPQLCGLKRVGTPEAAQPAGPPACLLKHNNVFTLEAPEWAPVVAARQLELSEAVQLDVYTALQAVTDGALPSVVTVFEVGDDGLRARVTYESLEAPLSSKEKAALAASPLEHTWAVYHDFHAAAPLPKQPAVHVLHRIGTPQQAGWLSAGTPRSAERILPSAAQNEVAPILLPPALFTLRSANLQRMWAFKIGGLVRSGTPQAGGVECRGTAQKEGMLRDGSPQMAGTAREGTPQCAGECRRGTPQIAGLTRRGTDQAVGVARDGTAQECGFERRATGQEEGLLRDATLSPRVWLAVGPIKPWALPVMVLRRNVGSRDVPPARKRACCAMPPLSPRVWLAVGPIKPWALPAYSSADLCHPLPTATVPAEAPHRVSGQPPLLPPRTSEALHNPKWVDSECLQLAATPPVQPRTHNPRRVLSPHPVAPTAPPPPSPERHATAVRKMIRTGFEGIEWRRLLKSGTMPLLLAVKEDADRLVNVPCLITPHDVRSLFDRTTVMIEVRAADKATADAAVRQLRAGEYTAVWSLYHQWVEAAESRRSAPSSPVTTFHRLRFEGKAWFVVLQERFDAFTTALIKDICSWFGALPGEVQLLGVSCQDGVVVDYVVVFKPDTATSSPGVLHAERCDRVWGLYHHNLEGGHHLPPLRKRAADHGPFALGVPGDGPPMANELPAGSRWVE
eukprot:gene10642-7390_t